MATYYDSFNTRLKQMEYTVQNFKIYYLRDSIHKSYEVVLTKINEKYQYTLFQFKIKVSVEHIDLCTMEVTFA